MLTSVLRAHVKQSKKSNFALENIICQLLEVECTTFNTYISIMSSLTCVFEGTS